MVAEIFVSYFFSPLALHLEMKYLVVELFFHTSIPWNLLDQFWAFCLVGFDLIVPFRVGCTAGKQDPAHSSQSLRSADTFSQLMHSSKHPKDVWEEWKFAEAAKKFSPRVLYSAAFSARFHTRGFPSATKVPYFTPDLPHQDVQRAMLESSCPPTMTFTSSQRGAAHTL